MLPKSNFFWWNYFHVPLGRPQMRFLSVLGEIEEKTAYQWNSVESPGSFATEKRNFALRGAIKRRRWQSNKGVKRRAFVSAEKSQWSPFIGKFDVDSDEQWDSSRQSGRCCGMTHKKSGNRRGKRSASVSKPFFFVNLISKLIFYGPAINFIFPASPFDFLMSVYLFCLHSSCGHKIIAG